MAYLERKESALKAYFSTNHYIYVIHGNNSCFCVLQVLERNGGRGYWPLKHNNKCEWNIQKVTRFGKTKLGSLGLLGVWKLMCTDLINGMVTKGCWTSNILGGICDLVWVS